LITEREMNGKVVMLYSWVRFEFLLLPVSQVKNSEARLLKFRDFRCWFFSFRDSGNRRICWGNCCSGIFSFWVFELVWSLEVALNFGKMIWVSDRESF